MNTYIHGSRDFFIKILRYASVPARRSFSAGVSDRENRLRGTESSWTWRGPGYTDDRFSRKGEGAHVSRRRIVRERTIDQKRGLTLIAGNTRGTRVVPARNDRRNETSVIYRLSPAASSRWLADEVDARFGATLVSSLSIYDRWRSASMTPNIVERPRPDRLLIGNEIEQELLRRRSISSVPKIHVPRSGTHRSRRQRPSNETKFSKSASWIRSLKHPSRCFLQRTNVTTYLSSR